MKIEEKILIEELFFKLKEIKKTGIKKDKIAEKLINKNFIKQPDIIYYMVQTILIQETAIKILNKKIEKLENKVNKESFIENKNIFSKFFNYNKKKNNNINNEEIVNNNYSKNNNRTFLGNALQTAVGVAGGVFMGNLLTNLFNKNNNNKSEETLNVINEDDNNINNINKNNEYNDDNFISDTELSEDYIDNDDYNNDYDNFSENY